MRDAKEAREEYEKSIEGLSNEILDRCDERVQNAIKNNVNYTYVVTSTYPSFASNLATKKLVELGYKATFNDNSSGCGISISW